MKSKLFLAFIGLLALISGFSFVVYRHNHASPLYGFWRDVKGSKDYIGEYRADGNMYAYGRHGETLSIPYSLDGNYILLQDTGNGTPGRTEWSVSDDGKYLTILNPVTGPQYFKRAKNSKDFGTE